MLASSPPRALLGLVLVAAFASAQEAQAPAAQLEASLREAARKSIPRTVLVKAIVDDSRMGSGSGAIISPDGWIITCSHVVELGKKLEVVTADGKSYPARMVAKNKRQDYALIKVEAQGLDAFPIGDSSALKAGDWVVALGHPGGPYPDLKPSFSAGQVRGTQAVLVEQMMGKFYDRVLVTDAPIFSGNSGGPLVNLQGELVGINAAIIQVNELGFSIPLHQITPHLEDLKAGKSMEGEKAGPGAYAKMQELISPEDMARMQKRMFDRLAERGGPFGDMLRGLFGENGQMGEMFKKLFEGQGGQPGEMPDLGELGEMFQKMFGEGGQPGEMPDLGEMFQKMFGEGGQPGEAPDLGELFRKMFGQGGPGGEEQPQQPRGPAPGGAFLGLQAAQGETGVAGVLVESALEGGPAGQAGVKKGDVVRTLDGQPVQDFPALRQFLSGKKPGDEVVLGIDRSELEGAVVVQKRIEIRVTLGSRQ